MTIKQWNIKSTQSDLTDTLAEKYGLSRLTAQILISRGIDTDAEIQAFLSDTQSLSDPFLLCDMSKAVERIHAAVENEERIVVYGDYDCDGITATTVLCTYLSSIGADVLYYIPEREMGYGLNKEAIRMLAKQQTDLIITVDNGISAISESELIYELGMDLLVTDHHQPGETLPRACAVVNPHRKDDTSPFKPICGVGVVIKLIAALEDGDYYSTLDYFADLAAIGTVADVVPLIGENRTIVKTGIRMLEMTENPGLAALLRVAGFADKELSGDTLAYGLAPRVNASGRMGSANTAIELLLSDEDAQAEELAKQLDAMNAKRQAEEKKILDELDACLEATPSLLNDRVLVLSGKGWHHGVIGIVSARVAERYGKPNVILSIDADGVASGSARSFGAFSLFEALSACSSHFIKFGGHQHAAGVTLRQENIDAFRKAINAYARDTYPTMPRMELTVDAVIDARALTVQNAESLRVLEPFGEQNKQPIFVLQKVTLDAVYPLSENRHLRLKLTQNGNTFYGLLFGVSTDRFLYKIGEQLDLAITLDVNTYHDKKSVSVKIKDIRPSGFDANKYFAAKDAYESVLREETPDARLKQRIVPTREEIGFVYKLLSSRNALKTDADTVFLAIAKSGLNYCKFRCAIDVLAEIGLIQTNASRSSFATVKQPEKKNLDDSAFLNRLKRL